MTEHQSKAIFPKRYRLWLFGPAMVLIACGPTFEERYWSPEVQQSLREVYEREDYATHYEILLPYAEAGVPAAEVTVAGLLYRAIDDDLTFAGDDEQELRRKARNWLRLAAIGPTPSGNRSILYISRVHERGYHGEPIIPEVSKCWGDALENRTSAYVEVGVVFECMQRERKMGLEY